MTIFSALFSLLAGALVLTYIVKTLLRAWFGKSSGRSHTGFKPFQKLFSFGVTRVVKQRQEALRAAKNAFAAGNIELVKKQIGNSFFFGNYSFFVLPSTLHAQHLDVLESLLTFSQSAARHASNLEKIERLIDELSHNHSLFLAESKNKKKFKKSPDWASKEFNKKRNDIKSALHHCEEEIKKEIDQFFTDIANTNNMTVH